MLPLANIANEAMAGLPRRLVQRLEVRKEPTAPSVAAASVAAAVPCINSSKKMKISPAANECLECGMRTGKIAASSVRATPASTCSQAIGVSSSRATNEWPSAAAPASTTVHQKRVAPGL